LFRACTTYSKLGETFGNFNELYNGSFERMEKLVEDEQVEEALPRQKNILPAPILSDLWYNGVL